MKQTIRMNEAELNRLISESVMRVLNESMNEETDEGYFGQMFKRGVQKGSENVKNAATSAMNKGKEVAGNIKQGYNNMQANRAEYNQYQSQMKQAQGQMKAIQKIQTQLNKIKQYAQNTLDQDTSSAINTALDGAIKACNTNSATGNKGAYKNTYQKQAQNAEDAQSGMNNVTSRGMFSAK